MIGCVRVMVAIRKCGMIQVRNETWIVAVQDRITEFGKSCNSSSLVYRPIVNNNVKIGITGECIRGLILRPCNTFPSCDCPPSTTREVTTSLCSIT